MSEDKGQQTIKINIPPEVLTTLVLHPDSGAHDLVLTSTKSQLDTVATKLMNEVTSLPDPVTYRIGEKFTLINVHEAKYTYILALVGSPTLTSVMLLCQEHGGRLGDPVSVKNLCAITEDEFSSLCYGYTLKRLPLFSVPAGETYAIGDKFKGDWCSDTFLLIAASTHEILLVSVDGGYRLTMPVRIQGSFQRISEEELQRASGEHKLTKSQGARWI